LFLSYLLPNSLILDFGCGVGRDTKYFLEKNYKVEALDGSIEMCNIASSFCNINVKNILFENFNEECDGIRCLLSFWLRNPSDGLLALKPILIH